jgi:hypothetical protein
MDNWKSLNADQKMKLIYNGKVIVIVSNDFEKTTVPLFCPVCELPMKTKEDSLSYKKYKCCEKCDNRWTDTPNINWEQNIGPDKSSEEWIEYYTYRLIQSRPIINLV